ENVICVEYRVLGDLLQAVGTVAEDVGQRAGEHPHLAVEGDHSAEGTRMLVGGMFLLDQFEAAVGIFGDEGQRPVGRQRFGQYHRSCSCTASALWGGAGLVECEVHCDDAGLPRTDLTADCDEVGAS